MLPHRSAKPALSAWRAAAFAGVVYTTGVFAIAFCLGAIRVTQLVPRVGALAGVLIEAPFVLAVSWFLSLACIRRFDVGSDSKSRLWMGGTAFACLLLLELMVSVLVFGETVGSFIAKYQSTAEDIGLLMQGVFAAMPWIQRRLRPRRQSRL